MGTDGVEMAVEVETVFVGAGCNRIVNNVSWGASDLLSFGAQNAVAIFCPKVVLYFCFTFSFSVLFIFATITNAVSLP